MTLLRIAEYPAEPDLPDNAAEMWEESIGAFLETAPCRRAVLASDGEKLTIVSEWESVEALEATMADPDYQAVLATLADRFGLGSQPEPTYLFQGSIQATV